MTPEQEKAKLDHEHNLTIKRILLEKGLLALIIVVFGFFANMGLENFKNGLADRRYLLEKHDKILSDLRKSYNNMSSITFQAVHFDRKKTADNNQEYEELLGKYSRAFDRIVEVANTSGRHFSDLFYDRLKQNLRFHEAIAYRYREPSKEYWSFATGVFENFDALTRHAVSGDKIEIATTGTHGGFALIEWTSKMMLEKKAGVYFDQLYAKWQRENP